MDIYLIIRIGSVLTGLTMLYKGIKNYEENGIYAKFQIGMSIVMFILAIFI